MGLLLTYFQFNSLSNTLGLLGLDGYREEGVLSDAFDKLFEVGLDLMLLFLLTGIPGAGIGRCGIL